jgi:hypothetical protein
MPVSRKSVLRAVLVLFLAGVVTTLIVPYALVESVLDRFAWLGRVFDFLDTVAPGLEVSHVLAFGVLGFLARFGWRNGRPLHLAIGLLAVAAFVETAQIWVPGRQAAVSHAILEALGGLTGLGVAWLLTYAWGTESFPDDYKPSTHWRGGDNSER